MSFFKGPKEPWLNLRFAKSMWVEDFAGNRQGEGSQKQQPGRDFALAPVEFSKLARPLG